MTRKKERERGKTGHLYTGLKNVLWFHAQRQNCLFSRFLPPLHYTACIDDSARLGSDGVSPWNPWRMNHDSMHHLFSPLRNHRMPHRW